MPRLSKIGAATLAAFGWSTGVSVAIDYLVVAGGGGAGGNGNGGGGGGAGGFLTGTEKIDPTKSYVVTIGAGGAGTTVLWGNGQILFLVQ
jgi:mucin-19